MTIIIWRADDNKCTNWNFSYLLTYVTTYSTYVRRTMMHSTRFIQAIGTSTQCHLFIHSGWPYPVIMNWFVFNGKDSKLLLPSLTWSSHCSSDIHPLNRHRTQGKTISFITSVTGFSLSPHHFSSFLPAPMPISLVLSRENSHRPCKVAYAISRWFADTLATLTPRQSNVACDTRAFICCTTKAFVHWKSVISRHGK